MSVLAIVLTCLDIVFAVALIVLFLAQEGNDNGMGVVGGASTDSFYNKQKGRTLEEQLKRFTLYCVLGFCVCSVLIYLCVSRGW
ncbi:MAG: preprotein translocase subunit SecG [Clostridiales bacterium]|nr:preprotein translocase subunit SecG [Clostridiales bacterium]